MLGLITAAVLAAARRAIRHAEWLPQPKTSIKISLHPMTHGYH